MNVNFDIEILKIDGSPAMVPDPSVPPEPGRRPTLKALTLKGLCIDALLTPLPGKDGRPETISGETKVKYAELARRIFAGGEVEISVDEASDLKKRIDRGCPYPLTVAQAWALLDPKG